MELGGSIEWGPKGLREIKPSMWRLREYEAGDLYCSGEIRTGPLLAAWSIDDLFRSAHAVADIVQIGEDVDDN